VTRLTEPKCVSALNVRRKQLTRRVRLKSVIALTLHISTTLLLDLVRGDSERMRCTVNFPDTTLLPQVEEEIGRRVAEERLRLAQAAGLQKEPVEHFHRPDRKSVV
jgi:hypothetical protein